MPIIWIIVLAAIALAAWRLVVKRPSGMRLEALKREYKRRLRVSEGEADDIMERQLNSMRDKFPGRTDQ